MRLCPKFNLHLALSPVSFLATPALRKILFFSLTHLKSVDQDGSTPANAHTHARTHTHTQMGSNSDLGYRGKQCCSMRHGLIDLLAILHFGSYLPPEKLYFLLHLRRHFIQGFHHSLFSQRETEMEREGTQGMWKWNDRENLKKVLSRWEGGRNHIREVKNKGARDIDLIPQFLQMNSWVFPSVINSP